MKGQQKLSEETFGEKGVKTYISHPCNWSIQIHMLKTSMTSSDTAQSIYLKSQQLS